MSDGITDSYRDQRRTEYYEAFLKLLAVYLEQQTDENLRKLKSAAGSVDDVPRGLITGQTDLVKCLDDMLAELLATNKRRWALLLLTAINMYPQATYLRLKAMSPFAGKILIQVDYGMNFVTIRGELQYFLDRIIQRERNMKIYEGDDYLVTFPESAMDNVEVEWLRCGIYGVKGPREARKK